MSVRCYAACLGAVPQTKRMLLEGISLGHKEKILRALAKAEELRKEWGNVDIPAEKFVEARAMLDIIEREEVALRELRAALATAGVTGTVGHLDPSTAAVKPLHDSVERIKSTTIRTRMGNILVAFAQVWGVRARAPPDVCLCLCLLCVHPFRAVCDWRAGGVATPQHHWDRGLGRRPNRCHARAWRTCRHWWCVGRRHVTA